MLPVRGGTLDAAELIESTPAAVRGGIEAPVPFAPGGGDWLPLVTSVHTLDSPPLDVAGAPGGAAIIDGETPVVELVRVVTSAFVDGVDPAVAGPLG